MTEEKVGRRETANEAAQRLTALLERADWRTCSRAHLEGARNALEDAAKTHADMKAALEKIDADLSMLRLAINAGDPKGELLLRIDDMRRDARAALSQIGGK